MGRERGTNTAFAVCFGQDGKFYRTGRGPSTVNNPVDICQWISFADFADIRECIWRRQNA